MQKLKLDMEDLEVETFEVADHRGAEGTVYGRVITTMVGVCSMSAQEMCDLPSDSITADVYNGACNTTQCDNSGIPQEWVSVVIC